MEPLTHRQILSIANMIAGRLEHMQDCRHRAVISQMDQLISTIDRLGQLRRQIGMATDRHWHGAAGKVLADAESVARDIPYYVSLTQEAIQRSKPCRVSLGDIVGELRQTQDEFGQLKFVQEKSQLSIVTDPIQLDDVYLGEFEIQLDISQLSATRSNLTYEVVALDPHPAGCNNDVTHPHVSSCRLCEGEASAAIAAALANGRIFDFFTLVKSVLTTYNPSSPYVALSDWFGVSCYECGSNTDADDLCYCNTCQHDFCNDCVSYCRRCDDTTCLNCLDECTACGERICQSCQTKCPHCGRVICSKCHEDNKCICIQEQKDKEDDDDSDKQVKKTTRRRRRTPAAA